MIGIKGIGVYEPSNKKELKHLFSEEDYDQKIKDLGVTSIPIETSLTATDMAIEASKVALKSANLDPLEIDLIVNTQASLHDYLIWQVSAEVQDKIGALNSYFFDLYQGCTGFIMGLIVAKQFLNSDKSTKNILLCTSEKWESSLNEQRTVGKLVFSDGGAAAVLSDDCTNDLILGYSVIGEGNLNDVSRMQIGAVNKPADVENNEISDYNYGMVNMFKALKKMVPINVDTFYKVGLEAILNSGLKLEDIKHLIFPSVGFGVFEKMAKKFEVPLENTNFRYVQNSGDGSTVDSLLSYYRMKKDQIIKEGDNVLVIGQGAGATWSAVVLRA